MTEFASMLNPALVDNEGLTKHLSRLYNSGVSMDHTQTALKVVQRNAGANQSVDISVGDGFFLLPTGTLGYWGWIDAIKNVPAAAANSSNPRYDTVVGWIDPTTTTTLQANSPGALKFTIYQGVAAGSPTIPSDSSIQSSLGAGIAWLRLADLLRPTSVNNISTGNISDRRVAITARTTGVIADNSITTAKVATGFPVQLVSTSYSASGTSTTILPHDDTIPQSTEGGEFMTQTITPKSSSNTLLVEANIYASHSVATFISSALFQDSGVNAIAANSEYQATGTGPSSFTVTAKVTAGTTSPITFRCRIGGNDSGTLTFNGANGNRRFGGISLSSIKVTEIKA